MIFDCDVTGSSASGWSVTYSPCFICALRGSSVELSSMYTFPSTETLKRTVWHLHWPADRQEPISIESSYHNHVEYSRGKHWLKSTLRIRDLKETDSKEYFFRILTHSNRFSGTPGIHVSVTGNWVHSKEQSTKPSHHMITVLSGDSSIK